MENNKFLTRWMDTLLSEDPDQMIALYKDDALLLPTLSNQPRHSQQERRDYFVEFLAKQPQCALDLCTIHTLSSGDLVMGGIYSFVFKDGSTAKARFSFCFDHDGLIVHHHSSLMPE